MSIHKKLAAIQHHQLRVAKNGSASLPGRAYRYATLDDILDLVLPVLSSQGLVLTQSVGYADGRDYMQTVITDQDTGESVSSSITLPPAADWHKYGSGLTYARRYGLTALLNIAGEEDDDAHAAVGNGHNHGGHPRGENPTYGRDGGRTSAPDAPPRQQQQRSPIEVPPCPDCGNLGMKSKWGDGFYCGKCKQAY